MPKSRVPSLASRVDAACALRAQLAELQKELSEVTSSIIDELLSSGQTKAIGETAKCTLVQGVSTVWDEEQLQAVLTTAQWRKVSVRKLDRSRLTSAIQLGQIDADLVEVARSENPSAPYLRW